MNSSNVFGMAMPMTICFFLGVALFTLWAKAIRLKKRIYEAPDAEHRKMRKYELYTAPLTALIGIGLFIVEGELEKYCACFLCMELGFFLIYGAYIKYIIDEKSQETFINLENWDKK